MNPIGSSGVVPAFVTSGLPLNQPVQSWPPRSHRGFVAAVAAGDYPVVPIRLTAAIESAAALESWSSGSDVGIGAFCERTLVEIRAGRSIPKGFATAALQAEHDGNEQQAAQLAAAIIRNRLIEEFPAIVTACAPEMTAGLRAQVGEALDLGRAAVHDLDGLDVTDVEALAMGGTDAQREAFGTFNTARTSYERARVAQRELLMATSARARRQAGLPGTAERHGLVDVLAAGVTEFSRPQELGIPADDLGPRERFVLVLERDDVWVPDLEDLGKAWANCRVDARTGVVAVSHIRLRDRDPGAVPVALTAAASGE